MMIAFRIMLLLAMFVGVICASDGKKTGVPLFAASGILMCGTFFLI